MPQARRDAAARPRRNQGDDPRELAHTLDEELDRQRDAMRRLGFTEDYREGVAAFLEKREAEIHWPMIISSLHKFIFVAIPKTGTHSVRQALARTHGPDDIEQVGLFVNKRFPIAELARAQHGHLGLQQVRPYLRPEEWDCSSNSRSSATRSIASCPIAPSSPGTRASSNAIRKGSMRHVLRKPPMQHILFQPQHRC